MTKPREGSVLVIGPGPHGRGGIAAVIRMHRRTATWSQRGARWLATYDDRSTLHKLRAAALAYVAAPWLILRADLVHLHLAAQTSLLRKVPFMLLARLLRTPFLLHLHAPSRESLRDTPAWARRFAFRSAARVLALSSSWAETLSALEPAARVVILPNPVRSFAARLAPPASPAIILFVGKLDARKGFRDLLSAAALLLPRFPQAEFWFAGHGELREAQAQAELLGIAHAVRLLGWVDGSALEAIFPQAHVVALPSYAEGVPMSILEAMSYGIPVVCTPVGGLPELIRDGQNGLFVTPGDVPGLARQLARLLADPAFAATVGAAGRHDVQERFSLEATSSALDALYGEVLAEARAATRQPSPNPPSPKEASACSPGSSPR